MMPTTLDEAIDWETCQMGMTQSRYKAKDIVGGTMIKCARHSWSYRNDWGCGPCAVEHFGGAARVAVQSFAAPNSFAILVVALGAAAANFFPTTLDEAVALEAAQCGTAGKKYPSVGATVTSPSSRCKRHAWAWNNDHGCGPCAVEHFGGKPSHSNYRPQEPNCFTPLVHRAAAPPNAVPPPAVPPWPTNSMEAHELADWQHSKYNPGPSSPRCERHVVVGLGMGWPYPAGSVCACCAIEVLNHHSAFLRVSIKGNPKIKWDKSVPNMYTPAPPTGVTGPAPHPALPSWRNFQHKAHGDCPCGIPAGACDYHKKSHAVAPPVAPPTERDLLRLRLEGARASLSVTSDWIKIKPSDVKNYSNGVRLSGSEAQEDNEARIKRLVERMVSRGREIEQIEQDFLNHALEMAQKKWDEDTIKWKDADLDDEAYEITTLATQAEAGAGDDETYVETENDRRINELVKADFLFPKTERKSPALREVGGLLYSKDPHELDDQATRWMAEGKIVEWMAEGKIVEFRHDDGADMGCVSWRPDSTP